MMRLTDPRGPEDLAKAKPAVIGRRTAKAFLLHPVVGSKMYGILFARGFD
jgi:hypothetical protein